MQQKPLLQNLVDTISLIRFKNTLYKYTKDEPINKNKSILLIIRILHLYEEPLELMFNFNFNSNILDVNNSFHASIDNILPSYLNENILNSNTNDISSYQFFKNIGFTKQINTSQKDIKTNEIAIESFLISEYCMPSKLYFYLSNGFNYVDNIKNTLNKLKQDEKPIYKDNMAIYLLKKIEASHLGLCFMGRLANFNYNNVRNDNDIYFYSHNIKPKITNISKFFTNNYSNNAMAYCCPPTIYQYNNLLDKTYNKVIEIQNKINKIIAKTLENMKQTKISKTYSSVIVNLYPVLLGIISIVDTISGMRQYITSDKLENDLTTNILYKDINTNESILKIFKKIDYPIINIEHFNNIINLINSYMYLFYYIFSNKVKIPQFIYNTIGIKPLIIYDSNDSILYPPQQINLNKLIDLNNSVPITDSNINSNINIPNIVNSSYMMVINNFNNGIFFMNKEIIKKNFVADKNTALPPSLHNILGEFYKINSKQLIKNSEKLHKIFDNIKDNMIKETKLQPDVLKLQKYYMGAKITEELIQIFAKSKIKQVALFLYNSIIQNNSSTDNNIMIEKLSYDINLDITIDVNSDVNSYNKILKLTDDSLINNILQANYHMIVENNNIVSTNIKTFVIYPSYYNNTNLLKSTYVVDINTKIIDILLYNRGNIFIYNMENISPLCLLIKQNNYIILKYITDLVNRNKIDNIYREPYNYLISQYKMNLHLFMPTDDIKNNIKQFVSSQYNDVKQIIQASDIYFNNILVNLELSFSICNYLTQQYLLERVLEYKYKFTSEFNTYLDDIGNIKYNAQLINCNDLHYNIILPWLNISDNDNNILIVKIIKDIVNKKKLLDILLLSYEKEKLELEKDNKLFSTKIEILNNKIINIKIEIDTLFYNRKKLYELLAKIKVIDTSYNMGGNKTRLIERYDILLMKMNYANNNYIDGWNKIIYNNSVDLFISKKIIKEKNNINGSIEYYEEMNKICIEYFESQRYYYNNNHNINTNNIIKFVYDTLIHLTRTIICSSIENIIRKILFETFNNGYYNEMDRNKKFKNIISKIDYIITNEIRNYLYNDVAKKFVKTSVSIFKDSNEKASYEIATVTEILNSFVDLMLVESFTKLDNNIIEILKNNIIPYYDTIVNKIIINWNITIENMFLYMINQYRYVKMIEVLQ